MTETKVEVLEKNRTARIRVVGYTIETPPWPKAERVVSYEENQQLFEQGQRIREQMRQEIENQLRPKKARTLSVPATVALCAGSFWLVLAIIQIWM